MEETLDLETYISEQLSSGNKKTEPKVNQDVVSQIEETLPKVEENIANQELVKNTEYQGIIPMTKESFEPSAGALYRDSKEYTESFELFSSAQNGLNKQLKDTSKLAEAELTREDINYLLKANSNKLYDKNTLEQDVIETDPSSPSEAATLNRVASINKKINEYNVANPDKKQLSVGGVLKKFNQDNAELIQRHNLYDERTGFWRNLVPGAAGNIVAQFSDPVDAIVFTGKTIAVGAAAALTGGASVAAGAAVAASSGVATAIAIEGVDIAGDIVWDAYRQYNDTGTIQLKVAAGMSESQAKDEALGTIAGDIIGNLAMSGISFGIGKALKSVKGKIKDIKGNINDKAKIELVSKLKEKLKDSFENIAEKETLDSNYIGKKAFNYEAPVKNSVANRVFRDSVDTDNINGFKVDTTIYDIPKIKQIYKEAAPDLADVIDKIDDGLFMALEDTGHKWDSIVLTYPPEKRLSVLEALDSNSDIIGNDIKKAVKLANEAEAPVRFEKYNLSKEREDFLNDIITNPNRYLDKTAKEKLLKSVSDVRFLKDTNEASKIAYALRKSANNGSYVDDMLTKMAKDGKVDKLSIIDDLPQRKNVEGLKENKFYSETEVKATEGVEPEMPEKFEIDGEVYTKADIDALNKSADFLDNAYKFCSLGS